MSYPQKLVSISCKTRSQVNVWGPGVHVIDDRVRCRPQGHQMKEAADNILFLISTKHCRSALSGCQQRYIVFLSSYPLFAEAFLDPL
jgi:hypothetical protein